ncbi:hypothetical protein V6N12_058010 [Hibiscus sabdariffa]|uniref:Uncharacterized protein n=1 Tax=Hibiscus sabdariffa TaxID=183260 RepID=A0ABR2AXL0_9ROSI
MPPVSSLVQTFGISWLLRGQLRATSRVTPCRGVEAISGVEGAEEVVAKRRSFKGLMLKLRHWRGKWSSLAESANKEVEEAHVEAQRPKKIIATSVVEIWKVRAELDDKVEALTVNEEKTRKLYSAKERVEAIAV